MTSGTLHGLGVGPGDPELVTLKAHRILSEVPVIAWPAPEKGESLARSIVAGYLTGSQTEIAIRMPLDINRFPVEEVYRQAADEIGRHLDDGRDVAAICEGDPFFYGSFMYLFGRIARKHRVEVVPGVSSLMACPAAAGMPLAARDDVLLVCPGVLDEDEMTRRLAGVEAAANHQGGPSSRQDQARSGLPRSSRQGLLRRARHDGKPGGDAPSERRILRPDPTSR